MSECVVRMEMPLNCFECPMYDWNRQKLCCNAHLDLRPIPNGGAPKPDWCPIICKLPEGHGQLVEAKALFERVYEYYGQDNESNENWMMEMINGAPTIVPAERSET